MTYLSQLQKRKTCSCYHMAYHLSQIWRERSCILGCWQSIFCISKPEHLGITILVPHSWYVNIFYSHHRLQVVTNCLQGWWFAGCNFVTGRYPSTTWKSRSLESTWFNTWIIIETGPWFVTAAQKGLGYLFQSIMDQGTGAAAEARVLNLPNTNPDYSILFYSRLCSSTASSSPLPESSNFLCSLPSLFILFPVAPLCYLYSLLVFNLILRPL